MTDERKRAAPAMESARLNATSVEDSTPGADPAKSLRVLLELDARTSRNVDERRANIAATKAAKHAARLQVDLSTRSSNMIGTPKTDTLQNAVIHGVVFEDLKVTTRDGRPARLAILDEHGNVIEEGPAVARDAWNVMLAVHRNFLIGQGHLRVHTSPTGIVTMPLPTSKAKRDTSKGDSHDAR